MALKSQVEVVRLNIYIINLNHCLGTYMTKIAV